MGFVALLVTLAMAQTPAGAPAATGAPPEGATKAIPRMVVVRTTASGATSIVLALKDSAGTSTDTPLLDDGQQPDVRAGDGEFAALARVEAAEVTPTLTVDGKTASAAPVSWAADEERRVLELVWKDGTLTAAAKVGASNLDGKGAAGSGGPGMGASAPGTMALPTMPSGSVPMPSAPPSASASSSGGGIVLYAALGVAIAALSAMAVVVLRGRSAPDPDSLPDVLRVHGAGVFGPGTPTLVAPVQAWTVSDADRPALLAHALRALAPFHPLVVATANTEAVPAAVGEGVFRSGASAERIADAARALATLARPTVILVLPATGESTDAWRTPVPGCRTIVLSSSQEGSVARFARDGAAWTCALGERVTPFA